MTDTDPLAPIEALADVMDVQTPTLTREVQQWAGELRAALAEVRQAVDALVVERDAARAEIQNAVLARNSAMRRQEEERRAKEGNIAALNAAIAERDAAREALARVGALVDEPAHSPGQCCGGYCLTGLHDLDRDTLASFREVVRAALAQPATDEKASQ